MSFVDEHDGEAMIGDLDKLRVELEWLKDHWEGLQSLVENEFKCAADPTDYEAERKRAAAIFEEVDILIARYEGALDELRDVT